MMSESHVYEKKSLRKAFGKTADLDDLAKTCVCLANAQGGFLHIGIENKDELPPAGQRITQEEANQLLRSLTDRAQNVGLAAPHLKTAVNGGSSLSFGCILQCIPSLLLPTGAPTYASESNAVR